MQIGTMPIRPESETQKMLVEYLESVSVSSVETNNSIEQVESTIGEINMQYAKDMMSAYKTAHKNYLADQSGFNHAELLRHRQNIIDILKSRM